jgi:hypothetical protein
MPPRPVPARGKGCRRPYELPPYPVRLADVARGLPVITSADCGASPVIKEGSNFLTDCH